MGRRSQARRHRSTDPGCVYYRKPRWVWQIIRAERARGKLCLVCLSGLL